MSLLHATVPALRHASARHLDDLRRVARLDRTHLSAAPDEHAQVASATSGWAARLALRVGDGRPRR